METITKKISKTYEVLKDELGLTNPMQSPRVEKIVVSVGIGSVKDKNKVGLIADRLEKITGQKAAPRGAKKSIATFKTRQGDVVGYQVTLRGRRAETFLEKLINIALPRTRDFRGVSRSAIDAVGNYTLGIREHTIFPETSDEELRDVFGIAVTIVASGKNPTHTSRFLEYLGMPFTKIV